MKKLDIIIPVYNEKQSIREVALSALCAFRANPLLEVKVMVVDDGSSDGTGIVLDELASNEPGVEVVHLWGNHGHQKALIAGFDHCTGDLILMMDGDGQHPVDTAVAMVNMMLGQPSLDIVQAIREGSQQGIFKELTSRAFYWIAQKLNPEAGLKAGSSDFRVVQKAVVEFLKQYPDRHRNLRVLLASLRLNTALVKYEAGDRLAGSSRYNFRKMLALAADGCFAFSSVPLRLSLLLMMGSGSMAMLYLVYVFGVFVAGKTVPGWASIIAFVSIMFTAVFGVLAILSEYIARIYEDVRRHPVYKIRPESLPGSVMIGRNVTDNTN